MATVEIEAASEVECVVCGAKKFSMFAPYVCHRCWKNGNAAKLIVLLQASGTTSRALDAAKAPRKPNCGDKDCYECNPPRQ